MADLAYVGAAGLVTKIKGAVAPADILFNNIHEHIRNRIENVISKVKARALSRQPLSRPLLASSQYSLPLSARRVFRGTYENIEMATMITGHLTALEQRLYPRFPGYGPWQHAY